jgi:hypothetical protein
MYEMQTTRPCAPSFSMSASAIYHESRKWTSNFRRRAIHASLAYRLIQAVSIGRVSHSRIKRAGGCPALSLAPYVPWLYGFDATFAMRTL